MLAEVAGQGADVGAGRTAHLKLQARFGWVPAEQLQAVDRDGSGRQLHQLAPPGAGIGPLASHMHRRHRRRALQDLAAEASEGLLESGCVQNRRGPALQHVPLQVIAAGAHAQLHHGPVELVAPQVGEQTGGRPEGDRQHTGHGGIEGAAMAHPLEAIGPPHRRHAAMGGGTGGFIDHQKTAECRGTLRGGWGEDGCHRPLPRWGFSPRPRSPACGCAGRA